MPDRRERESDNNLRRDREIQKNQVAGERVIAHVARDIVRHVIATIPDHFAVVGTKPDILLTIQIGVGRSQCSGGRLKDWRGKNCGHQ